MSGAITPRNDYTPEWGAIASRTAFSATVNNVRPRLSVSTLILVACVAQATAQRLAQAVAICARLRVRAIVGAMRKEYRKPSVFVHMTATTKDRDVALRVVPGISILVVTLSILSATLFARLELVLPLGSRAFRLATRCIALPCVVGRAASRIFGSTVDREGSICAGASAIHCTRLTQPTSQRLIRLLTIRASIHGGTLTQSVPFSQRLGQPWLYEGAA